MIPDLKAFAGGFLMSPIPLELSFNWCSFACSYCFANLNTPRRRSNTTQLLNFLADYRQRATLEATLLQQRAPVCISNLTDIFAPSNYHTARPVIEILVALGIPLQVQTRGSDRTAWRDEMLALIPPAVWYISITTLSERVRERIEPKAPTVASHPVSRWASTWPTCRCLPTPAMTTCEPCSSRRYRPCRRITRRCPAQPASPRAMARPPRHRLPFLNRVRRCWVAPPTIISISRARNTAAAPTRASRSGPSRRCTWAIRSTLPCSPPPNPAPAALAARRRRCTAR